jgi:hypothetical protein
VKLISPFSKKEGVFFSYPGVSGKFGFQFLRVVFVRKQGGDLSSKVIIDNM